MPFGTREGFEHGIPLLKVIIRGIVSANTLTVGYFLLMYPVFKRRKPHMVKLKNDRHRRVRGGSAELIDVVCSACSKRVILYQKDGPGQLLRCYVNRIFAPEELEQLQYDSKLDVKSMPNLVCECGALIGTPMRHRDNRLAFRLLRGSFQRRKSHEEATG